MGKTDSENRVDCFWIRFSGMGSPKHSGIGVSSRHVTIHGPGMRINYAFREDMIQE